MNCSTELFCNKFLRYAYYVAVIFGLFGILLSFILEERGVIPENMGILYFLIFIIVVGSPIEVWLWRKSYFTTSKP